MTLPNSGSFGYNGVVWASLYKSKVEVKPVKDSAGRALVAREYTIDVEGRIAAEPGSTTDATLGDMRRLLEMPAGALVYQNKGFGQLNVNLPGGQVWDAAYGPWPEVLAWDPIGNDQGCLVRWRCTTLVPCEEDPRAKGVIEYCWRESWDIDEHSLTKRVIEGHLTIEATRTAVNNRAIPDNADAYRNQVVPDLPLGFKRVQHFSLSEDKRTLEFHFEDSELPAALPDGLTTADVHHKVFWRKPTDGVPMGGISISGRLSVPARTAKGIIWDKIWLIVRSRLPVPAPLGPAGAAGARAAQGAAAGAVAVIQGKKAPNIGGVGQPNLTYFLDSIEVDDEVFGLSTSFSLTVRVIDGTVSSPAQLLSASRLWAPIQNTSFVSWRGSVFAWTGQKPYAPRGMAGMSFQNQDDAIVDLCGNVNVPKILQTAPGQQYQPSSTLPRQLNGVILDPRTTWLQYRLRLRLLENDRLARHKPIGGTSKLTTAPPMQGIATGDYQTSPGLQPPAANEIGGSVSSSISAPGGQGAGYIGTPTYPEVLQQVSAPKYTIVLEGSAVRIGYGIPTPRLATIGAVPVTQIHQEVSQEQVSAIGGIPIYLATWRIYYAMPYANADELPMPVNPAVY